MTGRCGYINTGTILESGRHMSTVESMEVLKLHVDRWHTLDWVESSFTYPTWDLYNPAALENGILVTQDVTNSTLAFLQLPTRALALRKVAPRLRSWTFDRIDPAPACFTLDTRSDLVAYLAVRCA